MSVEIFWTRSCAGVAIRTTVGSSSPVTDGSAAPFTFGSSLVANGAALIRSADWFVTSAPFATADASVISNSSRTVAPGAAVMLRTSTTPVPLPPPVALVLLVSAPAGTVTSASVPGWNAAGVLRASSSSKIAKLLSVAVLWFTNRRR